MADGGSVPVNFCDSPRHHDQSCEHFAEGGAVGIDFVPDAAPQAPGIDFVPDDQHAASVASHGTLGQQGIAALEGLAKGVAGPLATAAEVKGLGVDPEDIKLREEANPITHYGSEAAGLGLGALAGTEATQAGLLGKLGAGVSEGMTGAKAVAVKLGVENAFYQMGDEDALRISL